MDSSVDAQRAYTQLTSADKKTRQAGIATIEKILGRKDLPSSREDILALCNEPARSLSNIQTDNGEHYHNYGCHATGNATTVPERQEWDIKNSCGHRSCYKKAYDRRFGQFIQKYRHLLRVDHGVLRIKWPYCSKCQVFLCNHCLRTCKRHQLPPEPLARPHIKCYCAFLGICDHHVQRFRHGISGPLTIINNYPTKASQSSQPLKPWAGIPNTNATCTKIPRSDNTG